MKGTSQKKQDMHVKMKPATRLLLVKLSNATNRSQSNQIEVLIEEEAKRQNIQ